MNSIFFITALILSGCASHQVQTFAPEFKKENVCSDASLQYLTSKQNQSSISKKKPVYSPDLIKTKLLSLEPAVRLCYEQEIQKTGNAHNFNLCLITGYDKSGKNEFFEFSSKEVSMSDEFKECLNSLKFRKDLEGLKEVTITQPFKLKPKI